MAIAALNAVEPVRTRLGTITPGDVGLPIVVVAELLFGAYKSRRRDDNLRRITALRDAVEVLPLTDPVVER